MRFLSAAARPRPTHSYHAILFGVNETLLDLRPLKQAVVKAHNFDTIGGAALDMLQEKCLKPAEKHD
ncbi:hypothetical protein [Hymenobacter sp. GOD-10R]|uniref:hypothetical protein n=1 Tax=Hymenobacter sp. GOD-10R TaxID=3093922 RepID=UPI002D766168|nr:hypothetical protein [Hymenobacter sp. GOD-10R]WRQ31109.1 hypothetical protein SD425_12655 [Hymenobacter sp. GOD-10R]